MTNPPSTAERLASRFTLDMLEPMLTADLIRSLDAGIQVRAAFAVPSSPAEIFCHSVASVIRHAEADGARFALLQRFLRDGPRGDEMSEAMAASCLTDAETAAVIRYVFHRVITKFQGELAELLAVGACVRLLAVLRRRGRIRRGVRVHVGNTVRSQTAGGRTLAGSSDIHLLKHGAADRVSLVGVVEVKSHVRSHEQLVAQLERHIARARRGLVVYDADGEGRRVAVEPPYCAPLRIGVSAASWKLPRSFRFGRSSGRLIVDPPVPPVRTNQVVSLGPDDWRITLRWSHEALAAAAHEFSLWLMAEIGATVHRDHPRPEWTEMTPKQAGRNAVRMMLYYAILRTRSAWERRRAIALYNTFNFGYALGANFVNTEGHREMLWPEDLEVLACAPATGSGCRLR